MARRAAVLAAGAAVLAFGAASARGQAKSDHGVPAAWSPDGKLLIAGSLEGPVRLYEATGKLYRTFVQSKARTRAVQFSPDGKLALAGTEEGATFIWNHDTKDLIQRVEIKNEIDWVNAISMATDGVRLLMASQNRAVHLFELAQVYDKKLDADVTVAKLLRSFRRKGPMGAVAFSADGRQVLAGGAEKTVVVWDTESKDELHALEGHEDAIEAVAWAPGATKLALSAARDGAVRLWDTAKGKQVRSIAAHKGGVYAATFSRDGKLIATGGEDGLAKVWETATGKLTLTAKGHDGGVTAAQLSPDGKQLLTAGKDKTVRLWDAKTGKETKTLGRE